MTFLSIKAIETTYPSLFLKRIDFDIVANHFAKFICNPLKLYAINI